MQTFQALGNGQLPTFGEEPAFAKYCPNLTFQQAMNFICQVFPVYLYISLCNYTASDGVCWMRWIRMGAIHDGEELDNITTVAVKTYLCSSIIS